MADFSKITFFELQLLVNAAESPSIRSLARNNQLTPSHISKALKRLEQKTGVSIFKRSASGLLLTREGESVRETARAILQAANPILDPDGEKDQKADQVITLGSLAFLNRTVLPQALDSFCEKHPRYRFRLVDNPPDQLALSALKGAFDVICHYQRKGWTKNWPSLQVGEIKWKLFAGKDHPLRSQSGEAEVLKYAFVVPTYWADGKFVPGNDLCPVPWSRRRLGHETSTADGAAFLVTQTDQLAFLPECVAKAQADTLKEINVKEWDSVKRPAFLFVNQDTIKRPFQRALAQSVKLALLGGNA